MEHKLSDDSQRHVRVADADRAQLGAMATVVVGPPARTSAINRIRISARRGQTFVLLLIKARSTFQLGNQAIGQVETGSRPEQIRLQANTGCAPCIHPKQPDLHTGIANGTPVQVRVDQAISTLSDLQRSLDEPASLVVVPVSTAGGSATGWSREIGRITVSNIGE